MIAVGIGGGWLVGTLLAVLLDRLYTGAAWRGPVLPCRACDAPAPVLVWSGLPGYLILRGRCRACAAPLPRRLLYLPALASAVYAVALTRTDGLHMLLVLVFVPALLALTAADFEEHLLPNRIMYPTLLLALMLSWAWPGRELPQVLLGGAIGFTVMFVLFKVLPGFGFGDVKLAALLGLVAGASNVLPALMLASVAAGVVSVALLLSRRVGLRSHIAYGPYLALGAFAAMLAA